MRTVSNFIVSYARRTDCVLWLLCLALSGLSVVLLAGILYSGFAEALDFTRRNLLTQALAAIIGMTAAFVISLIDYRDISRLWKLYSPICYALLIMTFFFGFGTPLRPDDKRWMMIPFINFQFQPSEIMRIAFILLFAYHISKVRENINHPLTLALLLLHGAAPVVIIHFQGDDGTALIFAVIIASMLFCAGLSWKYVAAACLLAVPAALVTWNYVMDDFQRQRILSLYNGSSEDIQGVLYQSYRATIAFAMGGRGGKGIWGVNHVYIPEMHNDFIFSFLGECLGFVGCLFVFAMLLVMWFRILKSARRATDLLGSLICVGVFTMLAFQSVINIAMNLSLLPVIGNTLPFLSYGGSSMLTSYLGVGLVLSVHMHSEKSMFD